MKKLAIACALVLATVAACASSTSPTPTGSSGTSGTSGTPAEAGVATNAITVGGTSNKFTPSTLTIKAGDTVTWTWAGGAHTVTSGANCTSDMAYGTDGIQSTVGSTFTHTYPTAGTFEFFCEPHCASSGMKGTIVVQ